MQLYRWPISPYVRKVEVLLLKAGIHDRIDKIFISPFESENTPHDQNLFSKPQHQYLMPAWYCSIFR